MTDAADASTGTAVRRERVGLRRPPQVEGEPSPLVDLERLAELLNSGEIAGEITDANADPELSV